MTDRPAPRKPMRIKLTDERRERVERAVTELFATSFDEQISDFRTSQLVDFFVRELGPPVYNQAIQDAHAFIQDKLVDLEGEFYEPDIPDKR